MMPGKLRFTPLAAMLLLSACAVGPNYRRPDAPVAGDYKENKDWKPAVPAQVPSDQPWWSIYNDPVLDALERKVDVSNQTLKASEAAYRAAQAAIGIDQGALLPTITATGANTRSGGGSKLNQAVSTGAGTSVTTNGTTRDNIYSAGVQGSWQIDVWGRIRRTVESDVDKAQASAADVAAARLSAQTTLRTTFNCARPTSSASSMRTRSRPFRPPSRSRRIRSRLASLRSQTSTRPRPSWPAHRRPTPAYC